MKCVFIKNNNTKCNANALTISQHCFSHDPNKKEAKLLAVKKGGSAIKYSSILDSPPISIRSPEEILYLLESIINGLRGEPMDHHRANSIGYLSGVMLKIVEMERNKKPIPEESTFDIEKAELELEVEKEKLEKYYEQLERMTAKQNEENKNTPNSI